MEEEEAAMDEEERRDEHDRDVDAGGMGASDDDSTDDEGSSCSERHVRMAEDVEHLSLAITRKTDLVQQLRVRVPSACPHELSLVSRALPEFAMHPRHPSHSTAP